MEKHAFHMCYNLKVQTYQGHSWTIIKSTQNYDVGGVGAEDQSGVKEVRGSPRRLIDFSRFDDKQNSFSEPTIY